jgi:hypothetical protein
MGMGFSKRSNIRVINDVVAHAVPHKDAPAQCLWMFHSSRQDLNA